MNEIFFFSLVCWAQTRQQTEFSQWIIVLGIFYVYSCFRGLLLPAVTLFSLVDNSTLTCFLCLELFDPEKEERKALIGLWSYKALLMISQTPVFMLNFALFFIDIGQGQGCCVSWKSSDILFQEGSKGKFIPQCNVSTKGDSKRPWTSPDLIFNGVSTPNRERLCVSPF